jgi:hypothetical protein
MRVTDFSDPMTCLLGLRKKLCVSVIMVTTLVSSFVYSADRPRIVSLDEAKSLVLEALPLKTRQLPKFGLEVHLDQDSFYYVSAMWAGVPNGSVMIGNYAVDSRTGDVWSATTECEEESTPALRKLQAKVRLRIGLSDSEYHKINGKGPLCPWSDGSPVDRHNCIKTEAQAEEAASGVSAARAMRHG